MTNLSWRQRLALVFVTTGVPIGLFFWGFFTLAVGSLNSLHLTLTLLSSVVAGTLGVIIYRRVQTQPAPPPRSPIFNVPLIAYFLFFATAFIGDYVVGAWGWLIRSILAVTFGGLTWYIERLRYQQRAGEQQTHAAGSWLIRRPKMLKTAAWTLVSLQLALIVLNGAYQTAPCSLLDVPRKLEGCVGNIKHPDSVVDVLYGASGNLLATLDFEGAIRLWSLPDRSLLRTIQIPDGWGSNNAALSPDEQLIAAGSRDDAVRIWRVADGTLLHTLRGNMSLISNIAFSPDGTLLAIASDDEAIYVWRVADEALLHTFDHPTGVTNVIFTPDGRSLISGGDSLVIRFWDLERGALRNEWQLVGSPEHLAISPDGTLLASADRDHSINVWRVADQTPLHTLRGHTGSISSVAFSPDSTRLASGSGFDDETVRVWRMDSGATERIFRLRSGITKVGFSPDGQSLTVSLYRHVLTWQLD